MKKTISKLTFKKVIFLGTFSVITSLSLMAQSPGNWDAGNETTTSDAVGIGTTAPQGWQEIEYCDDGEKGLIISKLLCPSAPAGIFPFSFDGVFEPWTGTGDPNPIFIYPALDLTLKQFGVFGSSSPMLWARIQNSTASLGSTSGPYSSRFIVTPNGTSGVNIEVPRATFDVKSLGSFNYPSLIAGRQAFGSSNSTQHTMFIPLLGTDGYNNISEQHDQGMFFTDGKGIGGSNLSGSYIIAPWADPSNASTVGGLRIDNLGNLEVHGKTRTTQLNVNLKWWSDFVFDDDYKLMSLSDVEKFVIENKHLPNVPSEAKLKETGLDVGEMQAIQIQKIEELTLYTITQEKKINELKTQIKTQENEQLKQSKQISRQQKELEELKKKLTLLLEAQLQNK